MRNLKKIFNFQVNDDGIITNNNDNFYIIEFKPISILGYEDNDLERLSNIVRQSLDNLSGVIQMIYQNYENVDIQNYNVKYSVEYNKYLSEYRNFSNQYFNNTNKKYYLIVDSKLNSKNNLMNSIEIFKRNNIRCNFLVDKKQIETIIFRSMRMENIDIIHKH